MCLRVEELRASLAEVVADLDADSLPLPEAPAAWDHFDAIERLAGAAKTLLAPRVEESREWQRQGYRSAAEQLAAKGGTSLGSARAGLEAAKRVRKLPATQAALRKGALSGPQANALSDAAAANPGAEQKLLDSVGRSSLGELRDDCARAKAAADPDPDATQRRIHASRYLRRFRDAEGGWNLSARGTTDAGAQVGAALDPLIEEIFNSSRRLGSRAEREAYAFDALVKMARRARGLDDEGHGGGEEDSEADGGVASGRACGGDDGDGGGSGGSDGSGSESNGGVERHAGDGIVPQAGTNKPKHRVEPTHLALLRIDLEALARGSVQGEERCEITGLGPVPVSVARRLLGDSVLKLVLTNGTQVANVTHLGRGPNAAQRIALLWSQPTCSVQGCGATRVEADHRIPFAESHHTRLEEMDPLCRRHHDLKTYKGWALVEGTGNRAMVPPGDPDHPVNSGNRAPPGEAAPEQAPDDPTVDAACLFDDVA